ncbi:unnamed protein product [Gordionus sp. m RMFG-2023]
MNYSYTLDDFKEEPLYRDRKDWEDVRPLSQNTDDINVVSIQYSEKFKDAYDYLRALLVKNEISKRSLYLTRDCVLLNPANYTVWHYRRKLLIGLNEDWEKELEFTAYLLENNSKNYQLWHHRSIVVQKLDDASKELSFTHLIFRDDPKNYHAWQHRF